MARLRWQRGMQGKLPNKWGAVGGSGGALVVMVKKESERETARERERERELVEKEKV